MLYSAQGFSLVLSTIPALCFWNYESVIFLATSWERTHYNSDMPNSMLETKWKKINNKITNNHSILEMFQVVKLHFKIPNTLRQIIQDPNVMFKYC